MKRSKYKLGFISDENTYWTEEDDEKHSILRLRNATAHTLAIIPYGDKAPTNAQRIKFCIELQDRLLRDRRSVCLLVDIHTPASRNAPFTCRCQGRTFTQKLIREVSTDVMREMYLHGQHC